MKRSIFIIIGSISLLIVFSIWVYLLIFGAPKNVTNVFTNFGFDDNTTTERAAVVAAPIGQTGQLNIGSASLVQLSTRPVAGFGFVNELISTSTKMMRYAERGVGHIYEIDLETGVENRLLAKTFIGVMDADFSKDGKIVVLTSEEDGLVTTFLEDIDDRNASHEFPPNAKNVAFLNSEKVFYTLLVETGTVGYSYNLENGTTNKIFSVPLVDIKVLWGESETLIYNKTAPRLTGSLYRVANSALTKLGNSGYAFSALNNPQLTGLYIETSANLETKDLQSSIFNEGTDQVEDLPIMVLPEKCTFDTTAIELLWCTSPLNSFDRSGHNDWFKGIISSNDLLWKMDLNTKKALVVNNFQTTIGRALDAMYLTMDSTGSYLLFKNKIDDSLWLKDLKFDQ